MLIYQLHAELSLASKDLLQRITSTSPIHLDFSSVEVLSSFDPLEGFELEAPLQAITAGLANPFDEATQSSPVIMLLQSQDLQEVHAELGLNAWPYPYVPYLRLTQGSIVRKRHIVSFLNSISDTLNRNPVGLEFDSCFTTAVEVSTPPFLSYFSGLRTAGA